jgi:CDP-L-myo-inositol myo-inositolphosphotransferase
LEPAAKTALVSFESGEAASRRIAGVAAAARIVRELSEAGFEEARLLLPAGCRLSEAAAADVDRLAGSMRIATCSGGPETGQSETVVRLPGDRLIPARLLAGPPAGYADSDGPDIIRLDSPGASAEILRRSGGKAGDGPVSRRINRPISRRISAAILHLPGIRPNHVTLGTAFLGACMFGAMVWGGPAGLIAGALLFQSASILDGVDGEMARATFRCSQRGSVLDTGVDVATNLLFIIGLAVNLMESGYRHAFPFAAWGFTMFALGLAMIAWRSWRTGGPFSLDLVKFDYLDRLPGRFLPALLKFFTVITGRDFYALAATLWILAGLPMVILYSFAPVTTGWILVVIAGGRTVAPELAPRRI